MRKIISAATVMLLVLMQLALTISAAEGNPQNISFDVQNNQVLAYGVDTQITVSAPSPEQIRRIDLYCNGEYMSTKNAAPYTFDISSLGIGAYTFRAVAADINNEGSYAQVNISISREISKLKISHDYEALSPGSVPSGYWHVVSDSPRTRGFADAKSVGDNETRAYIIGVAAGMDAIGQPSHTQINASPPYTGEVIYESKFYISTLGSSVEFVIRGQNDLAGGGSYASNILFRNGTLTCNSRSGNVVVQDAYKAEEWFTFRYVVRVSSDVAQARYDFYINDEPVAQNLLFASDAGNVNMLRMLVSPYPDNAEHEAFYALDDTKVYASDVYPYAKSARFVGPDGEFNDSSNVPASTNRIVFALNAPFRADSVIASRLKLTGPKGDVALTRAVYDATANSIAVEFNTPLKNGERYKFSLLPDLEFMDSSKYGLTTVFPFTVEPMPLDAAKMELIVNGVEQGYNVLNANDTVSVRASMVNTTGSPQEATLVVLHRSNGRVEQVNCKTVDITGTSAEIISDEFTVTGTGGGIEAFLIDNWTTRIPLSYKYIKF